MSDKRELSEKFWIMSFLRWYELVKEWLIDKYGTKHYPCGYCRDAESNCNICLIDEAICNSSKYCYWEHYSNAYNSDKKTTLKYAKLILEYVVSEGRRLKYMTPELEKQYEELNLLVKLKEEN